MQIAVSVLYGRVSHASVNSEKWYHSHLGPSLLNHDLATILSAEYLFPPEKWKRWLGGQSFDPKFLFNFSSIFENGFVYRGRETEEIGMSGATAPSPPEETAVKRGSGRTSSEEGTRPNLVPNGRKYCSDRPSNSARSVPCCTMRTRGGELSCWLLLYACWQVLCNRFDILWGRDNCGFSSSLHPTHRKQKKKFKRKSSYTQYYEDRFHIRSLK